MDNMNALYAAKSKNEDIAEKIDRLSELKADIESKKQQADVIEAELLKIAQSDLSNTKYKSVKYRFLCKCFRPHEFLLQAEYQQFHQEKSL